MKKKILSLLLATALLCALAAPALANDMGKAGEYNILSTGYGHTAAVDANGTLWTWGDGYGPDGPSSSTPEKTMDNVAAVSCGSAHIAVIKTDGSLWTWGLNSFGQLGNGATEDSRPPVKVLDNVAAVSCGDYHTAAIKTDGSLWMWGRNKYGQLGNGATENSLVPVKVLDNVAAVSCAYSHTAAIQTDGSLWTWGGNDHGQLGNGFRTDSAIPVKVLDNVAAVSCGDYHTAAIKTDGTLWMWGQNKYGELGNGSKEDPEASVKVMDNVAAVSCGDYHTAAIKTDGSLWMWGQNDCGQLGNGSQTDSQVPVKVLDNVAMVSCAYPHTAAIKTDGSLWTWGENFWGQLGNGGGGNAKCNTYFSCQTVPIQIAMGGGVSMLLGASPALNGGGGEDYYTAPTAYASTQTVLVDGGPVEFPCYALKDAAGNDTNYIKLRDLASVLNGTAVQFNVGWDGAVNIETGQAYAANGSEMSTPFHGDRVYEPAAAETRIDGSQVALDAIVLKDDAGGAYTYYKLRDLGAALDFTVGWSAETGIYIQTN